MPAAGEHFGLSVQRKREREREREIVRGKYTHIWSRAIIRARETRSLDDSPKTIASWAFITGTAKRAGSVSTYTRL
jgi:hypothetical protein